MSFLLAGLSQPLTKVRRRDEEPSNPPEVATEAARDKLLVQLEARVRALEKDTCTSMVMATDSAVVTRSNSSYDEYIKESKKEGSTVTGGPELQVFYVVLVELESCKLEDTSLQMLQLALKRVKIMMEKGSAEECSMWVKTCITLPMYSNDKKKKTRLLFNILGSTHVCPTPEAEKQFHDQQMAAWAEGKMELVQTSPLELPPMPPGSGKTITINVLLARLLRAVGGQQQMGRAPRGNMARKVKGKGKGANPLA